MALLRAEIRDFRCLERLDLEFDPHYTLISGPNASGKTSLLEALFLLGRGRSFRTRHMERLIRHGSERFVVFGETDLSMRRVPLGIEGSALGTRAQVAGSPAQSLAELSLYFPVQVIDPEVHKLIEEGPARRRRYLDWGTFHVEHDFIDSWRRYQLTLRQRNAALKSRAPTASLHAWDSLLAQSGERIARSRQSYVDALRPVLAELGRVLLAADVTATLRQGWAKEQTLLDALRGSLATDQAKGATQCGPHRADLLLRLNGGPVKEVISRGQQKLLASALLLAQLRLLGGGDTPATLLLDDPAAELDEDRLACLIELVRSLPLQLIVSSLSTQIPGLGSAGRRYGLSDGSIRPW